MKRFVTIIFCVWAGLSSCKNDREEKCAFVPDVRSVPIDLKIESLEDSLPSITTKTQLVTFLTHHPELRDHFFGRSRYPNDSIFINELFRRFTNPAMDTLLIEAHNVFGNGAELKEQFRTAFANIKYYYPDFTPPAVQTIISGMETDLLVSDSLVV